MSATANEPNVDSTSSNDGPPDSTLPSQYKILTLTFNQDCTALAMGTVKTYALFTIKQDNNIDETHDCEIIYTYAQKLIKCSRILSPLVAVLLLQIERRVFQNITFEIYLGIQPFINIPYLPYEEIRIIERLFSSSLIALVSNQAPRKLRVCHFRKGIKIRSDVFPTTILTVKLNRLRLVVCLEETIWIYDIRNMEVVRTIRDVPPNPDGLCALSSNDSSSDLAYPGSSTAGEIQIFDTINLKPVILINAHTSPLAAISFDMSGTRIATASTKGTVIRIHNVSNGSCLFEFRRGVRRVATIYSLAFSPDSIFLAASSNTGTIHIFRLTNPAEKASEEASTWMGSFGRLLGDVAHYLPKQTSEVLRQDRAFATVHLQSTGMKTTIAMNILNKKLILFVASYDGMVFAYEINTNDGGECKQISQHLLFNMSQNSNNHESTISGDGRNLVDDTAGVYPPNLFKTDSNYSPIQSTQTNKKTS